jgi:hypothetical protein
MSRNLKLIGNIEKLFIPQTEYGKLIPGYYSSPVFRYFRPYTVDFLFLVVLGVIAYLNFLIHFPAGEQGWRPYLLPTMTVIYVFGFSWIQTMDASTRKEYFRFFRAAKGEPIAIGADTMPPEYLEFNLATNARFQKWASLAATSIIVFYGLREMPIAQTRWIPRLIWLVILIEILYLIISFWLSAKLTAKAEQHKGQIVEWTTLRSETLCCRWKVESAWKFFSRFVVICRWLILISTVFLVILAYSQQVRAIFLQMWASL